MICVPEILGFRALQQVPCLTPNNLGNKADTVLTQNNLGNETETDLYTFNRLNFVFLKEQSDLVHCF